MRYRPEIFALYDDLFKEAQPVVAKAPGLWRRATSWFARRHPDVRNIEEMNAQLMHQGASAEAGMREATERAADLQNRLRTAQRTANTSADELRQFQATPGALTEAQQARAAADQAAATARERASGMGRLAAGVGTAGVLGTGGAYLYGRHGAENERKRTRNLAFGAGAATGLALPSVVRGLGNIATGVGQTGLFPELQDYSGANPNAYLGGGYNQ